MRAFILTVAAACLTVVIGCETQNTDRELAEAPASAAPRVNLYPLTSPPPGSVQPLQGYAPTRITASQYDAGIAPEAGADGIAAAGYGTGAPYATGTYGTDPAFFDPNAAQVTYPASFTATAPMTTTTTAYQTTTYPSMSDYAAAQTAGFSTQTAAFGVDAPFDAAYAANVPNTTDPNSPYYCPPGAAYCPVPGSAPVANPFTTQQITPIATPAQPNIIYATAPAATTYQAPVYTAPVAAPAYTTTPAAYTVTTPTTTTASYTPPVIPAAPVAAPVIASTPAPDYSAPIRLSAAAYAPAPTPAPAYAPPPMPAYTPPAYTPPPARTAPRPASYSYQRDMPVGLHFGEVEGTADIVGPVPSLDPVMTPAPGAYSSGYRPVPMPTTYTAPNYSAPYVQPLSMNVQSAPASENIYAMAAPAPTAAPAPATTSAPSSASRRPMLLSSVAGVSARAGDATGYRLVPALDVPPGIHPNDYAPSQWFEVVRPGNGAVRIGRISATCVCVGARIPKRSYAAGERILVEARVLSKPSVNNVTYGLYVNIVEPVETVVDADVTLRF